MTYYSEPRSTIQFCGKAYYIETLIELYEYQVDCTTTQYYVQLYCSVVWCDQETVVLVLAVVR